MKVRAKFKVDHITLGEDAATVQLNPVVSGSKENENFYRYTPGGQIQLSVLNKKTAEFFVPGAEIYVDFSSAN